LATLIGGGGFDTAVSLRGADALDRARSGETFAAAIVDIHLPDISGLLVTQKLREMLGPDLPIIILSGDTSMSTLNSLPHVGATYFFSKPVNSGQLLDRLKEWVAGPDTTQ
jgi:CheY-like chemotaxis protein